MIIVVLLGALFAGYLPGGYPLGAVLDNASFQAGACAQQRSWHARGPVGRDSVGRIRIVVIVTRIIFVALVLIVSVMITVCLHLGRHASFGVSSASCAANALRVQDCFVILQSIVLFWVNGKQMETTVVYWGKYWIYIRVI